MEFDNFELTIEDVEALFDMETDQNAPTGEEDADDAANEPSAEQAGEKPDNIEKTKAFSKRLKEKTDKAVQTERENIAKSLGFVTYEEMRKSQEEKMLADKGLDPSEVAPIVEQLLEKRLNEDPRMKELENLRAVQVKEFAKKELAEITKLTDGEITELSQVPKDVIQRWQEKGSLKSAYLELKGEELLLKAKSAQSKGTTQHMKNVTGNNKPGTQRPLTPEERSIWKFFNPKLTDEELDKKTTEF